MWSRRQGRLKTLACGVEELRCRRREREAALRKARREQQLVSKRLLREDAPEEAGGQSAAVLLGEAEVQQFLRLAQRGTDEKEREKALASLRRGLQHPETQQTFIRLEGSMRTLVGLLTSNQALLQLEAARCLHELSHSEQSTVAEACLPATSYLLTYLSGHSSDFIELCLYTLGNLIVESEAVRKQLLPQGIVPALAACIQSPHVTVLEALGYALSQLLQAKEAPEKIIPSLLDSSLPQHMLQLMQPGPKLNLGVAVEFSWCLHYIICSQVNNAMLLTHGALPTLAMLLLDLAGAVQRMDDEGLELLACPVLRCLSNLLTEVPVEAMGEQMELRDERIVAALFILLQFFLQKQPTLLPEGLWLLNNLTGEPFSNPLAPDGHDVDDPHSFHQSKLTNEDFRKLLMTPRAAPTSAPPSKSRHHEMPREYNEDEDPAARRRKKKSYYAKLRQQEIERERELAEKYRDRAKERRDGVNKDYEETELISTTANYRAVGPTAEADKSAAEKRRQLIQESKFLGGDMEHTHLVKGLDFALLQKVRAEIASKEKEEEELMEKPQKETKKDEDPENKIEFKTRL
ncbi:hypothetical protein STEG23_013160, partial [Scotinomys teguina]